MKTKALGQGIVCLVAAMMAAGAMAGEAKPGIHIDAGNPGAALSPMLFGGFLEHMFTGIEGGLWGEQLEDRKFAGNVAAGAVLPNPWGVSFSPADAGRVSLEPPRHGSLPGDHAHSLKFVLPSDKPAVARLTAPIFVSAKASYRSTVWLRQETGTGHMRVWLESKTGERLAAPRFLASTDPRWQRFATTLSARVTDPAARFVCEVQGTGTLWLDAPSLLRDDAVSGAFDRQVWDAVRALHLGFLRYPGGNFAQTYHWRDGIGPRDDRPAKPNLAWERRPEPNDFGTDEYLGLCRALRIEPTICVNVEGDGATAQEAADWVAYCNAPATTPLGRSRAANGHPRPYGVKYWELGNEVYGNWEVGHTDAATYAKRAAAYGRAMRAVDPTIQLIAVGDSPGWNRAVLQECAGLIDWLAHHNYVEQDVFADLMAEPANYERRINETRALIRELSPQRPVRLAVNEWNTGMHGSQWQLRAALLGAGLLNAFARQSDLLGMACSSDLVNGWAGGVIQRRGAQLLRTPLYHVEELYRANLGTRLLPVTVTGPTFRSLKFNADLPVLDVTASAGPDIYLWVINRSEQDAVETEITVTGSEPKLQRATAWTLTAQSSLVANDFERPDRIAPQQTNLALSGERLTYRFPKHSVVVLRLSR